MSGVSFFFMYYFYNKLLRYPESSIYSHTKSINLTLKVKTPTISLKLGLLVVSVSKDKVIYSVHVFDV